MSTKNTRRTSSKTRDRDHRRKHSQAEKILLLAILGLGVLGLSISYSSKRGIGDTMPAEAAHNAHPDGKVRNDHMILHLNQREADTPVDKKAEAKTRF